MPGRRAQYSRTLSPREAEVYDHLRRGATHKEIAAALGWKPATVKAYVAAVYAKLAIPSPESASTSPTGGSA
jgi:DNA-binding NarL/FixJ family response regulator